MSKNQYQSSFANVNLPSGQPVGSNSPFAPSNIQASERNKQDSEVSNQEAPVEYSSISIRLLKTKKKEYNMYCVQHDLSFHKLFTMAIEEYIKNHP